MMKNSTKMISIMIMILSTIVSISSENWMTLWLSLEVNMMSFIIIMKEKNINSSKSMMTYFMIQSMSSILLLFSIIINPMGMMNNMYMNKMINIFMISSMMMKLGAAPMHAWFTWIMAKMNWYNCMILSTWQKIIPMFILSNMNQNYLTMNFYLMLSIIMGAIGGINQTSMKKMIAFSSVNHIGWMIMAMKFNNETWIKYILLYTMMIIMIIIMFEKKKINFLNQMNMQMKTKMEKMSTMIMFMSLGGLPPMIGFIPKWIVINTMICETTMTMMTIMIMMSMITLFYYMRVISTMIMENYMKNKWNMSEKSNTKTEMFIMMTNLNLPTILIFNMI